MIETRARYLRQIAGENGVYSCLPTSILNGWVDRGRMSVESAQRIQDALMRADDYWFPHEYPLNDEQVRPFDADFNDFRRFCSVMAGTDLKIWTKNPSLMGRNPNDLTRALERYAVVTDNMQHSFMLPSQTVDITGFVKVDPMCPDKMGSVSLPEVLSTLAIARYALVVG